MYWDGEAWHRLTPDISAKPKAAGVSSGNSPAPDIPARPETGIPETSTAATSPLQPPGHRAGLRLTPLTALLGICLLVVGFLSSIPILLTIGLIVLIVGFVLMAIGRWGTATPKAAGAHGATKPAPDIPATPKPNETRSGNKLFAVIAAGLVAIVVLGPVAGKYLWPSIYKLYCTHIVATCRYYPPSSPSSPSSGSPDSQQSQSPYYQEGYNSGTSGLARKGYGDNMYNTGATVAEMQHQACADAINNESNMASIQDSDHPANQDDYMRGCLDAFHDHPPTEKPKPGPLNPYR
jgi:hypothetical protein